MVSAQEINRSRFWACLQVQITRSLLPGANYCLNSPKSSDEKFGFTLVHAPHGNLDDLAISPMANAMLFFNLLYDKYPEGYGYERVKRYYRKISAIDNITENLPPIIVFMGGNDPHSAECLLSDKTKKCR